MTIVDQSCVNTIPTKVPRRFIVDGRKNDVLPPLIFCVQAEGKRWPMATISNPRITPEMVEVLARYAGLPFPAEEVGGAIAIILNVVDVLGEVDVATFRDTGAGYRQA